MFSQYGQKDKSTDVGSKSISGEFKCGKCDHTFKSNLNYNIHIQQELEKSKIGSLSEKKEGLYFRSK